MSCGRSEEKLGANTSEKECKIFHMRPPSEELNKKVWYRLFKVVAVLILAGAFIAPWISSKPSAFLLVDSAINTLIWAVVFLIIRGVILYIVYGKKGKMTLEKRKSIQEWAIWGTASFLLIAGVLVLIFILISKL